jgi:hypothetical protein
MQTVGVSTAGHFETHDKEKLKVKVQLFLHTP